MKNKYNYTFEKGKLTIYEDEEVMATLNNIKLEQAYKLFEKVVYEMRGVILL